jgi:hypothetical protein
VARKTRNKNRLSTNVTNWHEIKPIAVYDIASGNEIHRTGFISVYSVLSVVENVFVLFVKFVLISGQNVLVFPA